MLYTANHYIYIKQWFKEFKINVGLFVSAALFKQVCWSNNEDVAIQIIYPSFNQTV